jgi:regulator of replication initiation timing
VSFTLSFFSVRLFLTALKTVMNEIREHANDLSEANTVLTGNNDRLEEALSPLKDVQEKLAKIAKKNGASVNKLQELVRDNARCMYETHIVMRTDIKHTLFGVVFDADQDEDGVFTDKELRRLMTRFKNIPAVVVNEKVFEKELKRNKQVNTVLDLVATVHDNTIPDKEKALVVDEAAYEIPDDDSL